MGTHRIARSFESPHGGTAHPYYCRWRASCTHAPQAAVDGQGGPGQLHGMLHPLGGKRLVGGCVTCSWPGVEGCLRAGIVAAPGRTTPGHSLRPSSCPWTSRPRSPVASSPAGGLAAGGAGGGVKQPVRLGAGRRGGAAVEERAARGVEPLRQPEARVCAHRARLPGRHLSHPRGACTAYASPPLMHAPGAHAHCVHQRCQLHHPGGVHARTNPGAFVITSVHRVSGHITLSLSSPCASLSEPHLPASIPSQRALRHMVPRVVLHTRHQQRAECPRACSCAHASGLVIELLPVCGCQLRRMQPVQDGCAYSWPS